MGVPHFAERPFFILICYDLKVSAMYVVAIDREFGYKLG